MTINNYRINKKELLKYKEEDIFILKKSNIKNITNFLKRIIKT